MRVACACMMRRKRSRALASSRAEPCKVSMKPDSAASGVRSSWLALATKSARISSTRRSGVRSWNVISTRSGRARLASRRTGVTITSNQRSTGTRSEIFHTLFVAGGAGAAGSPRSVPACAARATPARPDASAGASERALCVERQHAAVAVERDDRIGHPGDARVRSRLAARVRRTATGRTSRPASSVAAIRQHGGQRQNDESQQPVTGRDRAEAATKPPNTIAAATVTIPDTRATCCSPARGQLHSNSSTCLSGKLSDVYPRPLPPTDHAMSDFSRTNARSDLSRAVVRAGAQRVAPPRPSNTSRMPRIDSESANGTM